MHEHIALVKKNRAWDRLRKSRNITIDKIAEFWCLYCLKCDAPIHNTIRNDGVPAPRYSKGIHFTCQDPDNHRDAHTYCDMGEPECLSCGQFLGCTGEVVECHRDDWQGVKASYVKEHPMPSPEDFTDPEEYQAALEAWKNEVPREMDYGTVYGDGPFAPGYNGIRAHVVAYVVSQDSRPENIVPLCWLCHGVDPSFDDRREYLDWILDRRATQKENMEVYIEKVKASKIISDVKRDTALDAVTVALDILCERPRVDPMQPFGGRAGIAKLEDMLVNRMPEIEARRVQIMARPSSNDAMF